MTEDIDLASTANRALAESGKAKRLKKPKKQNEKEAPFAEEYETRFGVLPPGSGAWGGGSSGRKDDDSEEL